MVSEKDFNLFKDILTYFRPVEITKNVFGVLFDIDVGFSFKYKTSDTPDQLKNLIVPVLEKMLTKKSSIQNEKLRLAYSDKVRYYFDKREKIN